MKQYRFSNTKAWETFWDKIDSLFTKFIDPIQNTKPTFTISVHRTSDMFVDKDHMFEFYVHDNQIVYKDTLDYNEIKWTLLKCNPTQFRKLLKGANMIR